MQEEPLPGRAAHAFRARLADPAPLVAVELRPPRRELDGVRAMEAWIDVYQSIRRLTSLDTAVFLTDNAVGASEEENLAHIVNNLGRDAARERVVPFLTLKHPLAHCLGFAARARRERFPALVVLGGDRHDGVPRCLPHSCDLRRRLRREQPGLALGGWLNPYADIAAQLEQLLGTGDDPDFLLTQVVSHHDPSPVEKLADAIARRGVRVPVFPGVFYYRSARPETLALLSRFLPVPQAQLAADFGERGMHPEQVAARTLAWLAGLGFTRFYVSNIETGRAPARLTRLCRLAGLPDPGATSTL
ncbi:MAG: hypothetical protein KBD01_00845 [Acidobacteria bacterium]|nr:hypothetical protein [Acidobacteriota bacterium]